MSRVKVIAAAVIFFVLTLVKLAFPDVAGEMRRVIVPQIKADVDLRAAMVSLGERITGDDGIVAALGRFYDNVPFISDSREAAREKDAARAAALAAENTPRPTVPVPTPEKTPEPPPEAPAPTTEPTPVATPEPTPEATPEPTPSTSPTPEAVMAFLATQEEYEDEAIPANVSYDMPELPFEYASPAAGWNSSGFGFRTHPVEGEVKFHYGTDIAAWYGTDIAAFADGTVLVAGDSDSYGKYIIISHADGYSTLYAHCSELLVENGQSVTCGQVIARVGDTGVVTGAHLHFELIKDNVYINPEFYLS